MVFMRNEFMHHAQHVGDDQKVAQKLHCFENIKNAWT